MSKRSGHHGIITDGNGDFAGTHGPEDECPDPRRQHHHDGDDHVGPANWNSSAYRSGWEETFGKKPSAVN